MGRPALNPTSIHLTLLPEPLARLDAWRSDQAVEMSRAEAVRQILDWAFMKMDEQRPARGRSKTTKGKK